MTWEDMIKQMGLEGQTQMVRRDQLQPGDEAISSHYGRRTVKSVLTRGAHLETTEIIWDFGDKTVRNEIYGSGEKIPKILPVHHGVVAYVVTTKHSRCPECNALVDSALKAAQGTYGPSQTIMGSGDHQVTVESQTRLQRRAELA